MYYNYINHVIVYDKLFLFHIHCYFSKINFYDKF